MKKKEKQALCTPVPAALEHDQQTIPGESVHRKTAAATTTNRLGTCRHRTLPLVVRRDLRTLYSVETDLQQ